MKILLMMSFLGLFGCKNNTKEIQYDNLRAYFWLKIDQDAPCDYFLIGVPNAPYQRDQKLEIFYKDGSSLSLNHNNILNLLSAKYGKSEGSSLDGKKGPGRHPGKSFFYPKGLVSYDFGSVDLIYKGDQVWGVNLSCIRTQKIKKKGEDWENENLPNSKFITHILINGKQIDLPIKEKALFDALGKPNNKLEYLSQ